MPSHVQEIVRTPDLHPREGMGTWDHSATEVKAMGSHPAWGIRVRLVPPRIPGVHDPTFPLRRSTPSARQHASCYSGWARIHDARYGGAIA